MQELSVIPLLKSIFRRVHMWGLRKLLLLLIIIILSSSCGTNRYSKVESPLIFPQYPKYIPEKRAENSLWSEQTGLFLFRDKKAIRVGDVITIRIVEDPEAELNANTKTDRSSSLQAKLKFLGFMKALADKNPRLAQNPAQDTLIDSSLGFSFDGKGSSNRKGHVKAYISAIVMNVLPNGNLYIEGRREIKVNNELQYITISGIVRPEDIDPDNEVSSVYVANARITYSGIGPLSDKQKPGWMGRVLDHVWPF